MSSTYEVGSKIDNIKILKVYVIDESWKMAKSSLWV